MNALTTVAFVLAGTASTLLAGTVVITTLPDATHPLPALTSVGGVRLVEGTEVRVGAFPGLSDEAILDVAAHGGFAQTSAAFVQFGSSRVVGDGVDGAAGNFEIAVHQATPDSTTPCAGEEVSLLIRKGDGEEFLVARFKGSLFEVDSATGLEPLLSLHLADGKVIVGNRYDNRSLSTATPPVAGSFDDWIGGFYGGAEASKRFPAADPDGDGRSNFLEYSTGGDPTAAGDEQPCQLLSDEQGDFWVRFSRASGIGSSQPVVESSGDLLSPWLPMEGSVEADPDPPSVMEGVDWLRIRVPQSNGPSGFFRLGVETGP